MPSHQFERQCRARRVEKCLPDRPQAGCKPGCLAFIQKVAFMRSAHDLLVSLRESTYHRVSHLCNGTSTKALTDVTSSTACIRPNRFGRSWRLRSFHRTHFDLR